MSCGGDPGHLAEDLEALAQFFGPGDQRGLRARVNALPRNAGSRLPDRYVLIVDGRAVMTPEGRIALERLRDPSADTPMAHDDQAVLLTDLYRGWSHSPLSALAQNSRSISPRAMGVALLAVVNGSDTRERALTSSAEQPPELLKALHAPIEAFAAIVAKRRCGTSALMHDYPSQQAARVLRGNLIREKARKQPVRVWVPSERRVDALRGIADRVVGHDGVPVAEAVSGVQALLAALEAGRPVLQHHSLIFSEGAQASATADQAANEMRAAG
jgi:hypothetical protein